MSQERWRILLSLTLCTWEIGRTHSSPRRQSYTASSLSDPSSPVTQIWHFAKTPLRGPVSDRDQIANSVCLYKIAQHSSNCLVSSSYASYWRMSHFPYCCLTFKVNEKRPYFSFPLINVREHILSLSCWGIPQHCHSAMQARSALLTSHCRQTRWQTVHYVHSTESHKAELSSNKRSLQTSPMRMWSLSSQLSSLLHIPLKQQKPCSFLKRQKLCISVFPKVAKLSFFPKALLSFIPTLSKCAAHWTIVRFICRCHHCQSSSSCNSCLSRPDIKRFILNSIQKPLNISSIIWRRCCRCCLCSLDGRALSSAILHWANTFNAGCFLRGWFAVPANDHTVRALL